MAQERKIRYYRWRGINPTGKRLSGIMVGYQEQEIRAKLNEQQIQAKKIKRYKPSTLSKRRNQFTSKDVTAITRQLATIVNSGVPVVQALKLIAHSHNKAEARATLTMVSNQVEAGLSLARALNTSSPLFDNFYCDLVATGEQTGHLAQAFERLATYREKSEAMRKKVIKAMIYPIMVTITAILVTLLMLIFVIPQFANIFKGFGAELPWLTQKIIDVSNFLLSDGPLLALGLLAVSILAVMAYRRSDKNKLRVHRALLVFPIVGPIMLKAAIARFARTLATTFSSGIPLLSGIEAAGKTAGNRFIEQAIEGAHSNTAAGMPLHLALRHSEVFPELMLQMVMIGEESGSIDDMLNKIAFTYESDVDNTVDNLGKILEPLIILFLGGVIGGLLVAMYMPVFKLMSVVG
ncbi:type II secretion system F family protein [Photobacterium sp. DNB23_23_1]|uniref:Type II secretion system F family protein n=1 Tax=Photobacterium pectinilyticum TaxID=2906793 RepID=A0ABT1MXH4_9GAMM|nr:type II secretion system F family protein [Photobacterium sp. ZSDE20]MCQ1057202.1 type II secretion system F family protein [Photobacterium sp. ZSDE20]MDD1821337.1 type II secretion system F family protein [Photobacterium sp. ZSDE20]